MKTKVAPSPAKTTNEAKPARSGSRYSKVDRRTWGDERFCALSPILACGQGLWLHLLTGPHNGPIPGLFRAGRASLAEQLDWSPEAFDIAFGEVFQEGMAKACWQSRVVWVPNAIKYNKPESPNVVRSWSAEWELIPECDLKREAYEHLKASVHALGEPFGKAFDEAIAKPSPKPSGKPLAKAMANQEQEQEQEHSEAKASDAGASLASPMSAKEQVWTLGLALLGERCRPMLGKLVATYSDSVVAEALAAAAREQPVDPKAWVTAACAARGAPKANGRDHRGQRTTEDLLDCDPRPPWLEGTGFDDVWQAESAGCGPGNARQFSNGQRAQA